MAEGLSFYTERIPQRLHSGRGLLHVHTNVTVVTIATSVTSVVETVL